MGVVRRGAVYWVNLDPPVGTEIHKTRPGLVISPDDMNATLPRIIVAPDLGLLGLLRVCI